MWKTNAQALDGVALVAAEGAGSLLALLHSDGDGKKKQTKNNNKKRTEKNKIKFGTTAQPHCVFLLSGFSFSANPLGQKWYLK